MVLSTHSLRSFCCLRTGATAAAATGTCIVSYLLLLPSAPHVSSLFGPAIIVCAVVDVVVMFVCGWETVCDDVSNRNAFVPLYGTSACNLVDLHAEIQTVVCDVIGFPELVLLDAFVA